jgi:type I restriction enzyme S subunit
MASEWKEFFLAEVGRIVTGKTPKGGIPEYEGKEVQFVTPADFVGDKWITRTARTISEAGAESVKGSVIEPRNVLVTCIGSDMGKAAIATKRCVANQQINSILVDEFKFCAEFIYYNLSLRKNEIRGIAGGSAQPILNKSAFSRLTLNAPVLSEQKRISAMLRPLDDRITLLRETNATLEAIAQALFKSWFVDFDPVRAKSEGKLPDGMDEATAALFPDAFEEAALGIVPKGWRVLPFLDACDLQGGSQPPASVFIDELRDGYVRLLQIRDFSSDAHTTYIPDTTKLKKVTEDDVLIGRYGSASGDKAKDSLGRVCRGLSGAYNVALMKLNPLLVGREFAFQLVSDPRFYNYLQAVSSKAVQSGFSKSELAQYTIALPNSALIERYEQFGVDFWLATKTNNERIKTLKTLRDTLLPRLISGQLRIADAQAELEKVTA